MNLCFLDTETTGKEVDDQILQVAYSVTNSGSLEPFVELFLPRVPISYGAMAVHHITNEMVNGKPYFADSDMKKQLVKLSQRSIMVAHNAPFDLRMLEKEGVKWPIYIDTLRVARHLIEAESYKLQFLRYFLDLRVEGTAHDAAGDVKVLMALFEKLMTVVMNSDTSQSEMQALDKMVTLSNLPVTLKKLDFGKYYGRTFEDVLHIDRQYLAWLYSSEKGKSPEDQNEDMIFTLDKYLNKKSNA